MARHTYEQGGRGREAQPRETARGQAAHSGGHRTAAAVPWRGSRRRRRRHRHRELHRCFQGLGPQELQPGSSAASAPRCPACSSASGRGVRGRGASCPTARQSRAYKWELPSGWDISQLLLCPVSVWAHRCHHAVSPEAVSHPDHELLALPAPPPPLAW